MGDQLMKDVEAFLLDILKQRESISAPELFQLAEQSPEHLSPSAVTWGLWYLVGEGKITVTHDNLVKAA
jgi:hypothetical protein